MNSEKSDASLESITEAVIGIATESRRFVGLFDSVLKKLDAGEGKRYVNQHDGFIKKIKEALDQAGFESEKPDVSLESITEAVIGIATESWRFVGLFNSMLKKLDAGEGKRYVGQRDWFIKKIKESMDQAGFKIVNLEGTIYDPGMAATALNIEEFSPGDTLVVNQMLEPIIMGKDGLVKTGTVILRRVEQ